ncbi:Predicted ATPase [Chitinophaga sp. CF118]|uniref:AAA family ATPase n=1 Tax=Chitinophaga sp. CF118 TaxID=1884367 RepID=UPI0008F0DB30|nr:AAA family ATPase [Chitinophaga sp. CF118]SFE96748.1 Predicted ATPase [Chitinophaga sp. CF118]
MSKIKIKNFGPIKEGCLENDGWIDVKKVTVFIGNQGSGKSVIAKLLTTFMWMEKALTRGDYDQKWFSRKNKLRNQFLTYFRLENYFPENDNQSKTFIDYRGESFNITFENDVLYIEDANNRDYPLPQIMYVPAERNFIANVRTPKALKLTSDYLLEFVTEFDNAKEAMKGPMLLPINEEVYVEYNKLNDIVYLKGKDYRIKLTEASSGFQSLVPLFLVSWYLSNSVKHQSESTKDLMTSDQRERFRKRFKSIDENLDLTEEQKRIAISEIAKEFTKTAFVNIVEEPEQNLFPVSQHGVLNRLIEFNNFNAGNKLIITTHSPYLINYLTLSVKANMLKERIQSDELQSKLQEIVPLASTIKPDDLVVYELKKDGSINKLGTYNGLPSDENELNERLGESNELFAKLLEIQQAL